MKLKGCPYCGSTSVVAEVEFDEKRLIIFCENCPAEMNSTFSELGFGEGEVLGFVELTDAIYNLTSRWNMRAQ